jgi:alcohol dehydrogenase class IV
MRFEFATASRIAFGKGTLDTVPPYIRASRGERAFVVTGSQTARAKPVTDALDKGGIAFEVFSIAGEPTCESVLAAVSAARAFGADTVVGMGGGSPVDAGKAVAALLTNDGDLMDYLEVIGGGKPIAAPPLPYVAVPTTAGTGAEVTRNAVIGSTEHRVKVSMRSPLMLPALAVVDPTLTAGLPRDVTAVTGLDALTQLIEPFVSKSANPLTDSLCREGMAKAARALERAYRDGGDLEAREDMCLASLFGGLALANAKLGAVHGFAGPIGGMFDAPHGAICAKLLAPVIETNVRALLDRDPSSPALAKLDEMAALLTGVATARARDGARFIGELCEALDLRTLSTFGVSEGDFPSIIDKAKNASSMKGNPIELTESELREILERSLAS